MKKFLFIVILVLTFCNNIVAQSLAINTTGAAANASAILDVSSFSKGVLVPRMTKGQKNAIASPAIGLLIYRQFPIALDFIITAVVNGYGLTRQGQLVTIGVLQETQVRILL
ncbi:MAG: hypothetical protein IPP48_09070 [Chitinophagaceae bacterium]|nr:hypothetical protein [Chitinophagaceae bacterium]